MAQDQVELTVHPTLGNLRVLAVVSPANWGRMVEIESLLKQAFPQVDVSAPSSLAAMEETIRGSSGTADLVIAMGGDGTLHRALQWIDLDSQILVLLPGGTGNDLARSLGYPEDLHGRAAHLLKLVPQTIDLGLLHGVQAEPIRYHTCAGLGLDAATLTVRDSNELLRRNYKLAFLWVLFKLKPISARLVADGREINGTFSWILTMNSRDIGRGVQIAPDARLDDGLLDLVLVDDLPKLEMIRLMPRANIGAHVEHAGVTYLQAADITCELESPGAHVAVDGELYDCSTGSIRFSLKPKALRILR
jgi:diacylglycerol kinase (ATP)